MKTDMKITASKSFRAVVTVATVATAATLALAALPAQAGKTIDAIKARAELTCSVNTGLAGFSQAD